MSAHDARNDGVTPFRRQGQYHSTSRSRSRSPEYIRGKRDHSDVALDKLSSVPRNANIPSRDVRSRGRSRSRSLGNGGRQRSHTPVRRPPRDMSRRRSKHSRRVKTLPRFEDFTGSTSEFVDFKLKTLNTQGGAEFKFFHSHKDEEWFQHRYNPVVISKTTCARDSGALARGETFLTRLLAGEIDTDRDMIEPASVTPKETDDDQFVDLCLFARTISPKLRKEDLEAHFSSLDGFVCIMLSEPSRKRDFNRVAWIQFESQECCVNAMEQLAGKKIAGWFAVELERNQGASKKHVRHISKQSLEEERVVRDFSQALSLIKNIEERGINSSLGSFTESVLDSYEFTLQKLNICIAYLREVHLCCYYCGKQYRDMDELTSRCHGVHLRSREDTSSVWTSDAHASDPTLKDCDEFVARMLSNAHIIKSSAEVEDALLADFWALNVFKLEENKFSCGICSKLFMNAAFVKKHLRKKHSPELQEHLEKSEDYLYLLAYVNDDSRPTTLPKKSKAKSQSDSRRTSLNYQDFDSVGKVIPPETKSNPVAIDYGF